MAEPKTRETNASVAGFIDAIEDAGRREDCREVARMMQDITGEKPRMWGTSMVGFGRYHYRYASGREGDWFQCGFAPRKQALTLYIMSGFRRFEALTGRLGKYRTGKSCLYLNRLDDIDRAVLEELIRASVKHIRETYESG